jgi:hypothetical protein
MGSDALCCGVYCRNTEKYHLIVKSPPIKEEKKKEEKRKKKKRKKNYSTQYSRVVSHRSTD